MRAPCALAYEYISSHRTQAKNEAKEYSVAWEWRAPASCQKFQVHLLHARYVGL